MNFGVKVFFIMVHCNSTPIINNSAIDMVSFKIKYFTDLYGCIFVVIITNVHDSYPESCCPVILHKLTSLQLVQNMLNCDTICENLPRGENLTFLASFTTFKSSF